MANHANWLFKIYKAWCRKEGIIAIDPGILLGTIIPSQRQRGWLARWLGAWQRNRIALNRSVPNG